VFTPFTPRDIGHPYLSARNLLRNLLALASLTPEGAAAAATAKIVSARNLLRSSLGLAWIAPEGAAAAATAKIVSARNLLRNSRGANLDFQKHRSPTSRSGF